MGYLAKDERKEHKQTEPHEIILSAHLGIQGVQAQDDRANKEKHKTLQVSSRTGIVNTTIITQEKAPTSSFADKDIGAFATVRLCVYCFH